MQLFMFFIDSNTPHVSGASRPSSGVQELCVQPRYWHVDLCKDR